MLWRLAADRASDGLPKTAPAGKAISAPFGKVGSAAKSKAPRTVPALCRILELGCAPAGSSTYFSPSAPSSAAQHGSEERKCGDHRCHKDAYKEPFFQPDDRNRSFVPI